MVRALLFCFVFNECLFLLESNNDVDFQNFHVPFYDAAMSLRGYIETHLDEFFPDSIRHFLYGISVDLNHEITGENSADDILMRIFVQLDEANKTKILFLLDHILR
jgi:hypothetical protein